MSIFFNVLYFIRFRNFSCVRIPVFELQSTTEQNFGINSFIARIGKIVNVFSIPDFMDVREFSEFNSIYCFGKTAGPVISCSILSRHFMVDPGNSFSSLPPAIPL